MANDLPNGYRPSEGEPFMNERQREYFRRKLIAWKEDILRESRETILNLQSVPCTWFGSTLVSLPSISPAQSSIQRRGERSCSHLRYGRSQS